MKRTIGTIEVAQDVVLHFQGYETAAWWEDVNVAAGSYPVQGEVDAQGKVKDLVFFGLPGTVVADYFRSLWGGMPMGQDYDRTQNAGKPSSYRGSLYLHASHGLLNGGGQDLGHGMTFRLADDLQATAIQVDSFCQPGTKVTLVDVRAAFHVERVRQRDAVAVNAALVAARLPKWWTRHDTDGLVTIGVALDQAQALRDAVAPWQ